MNIITYIGIQRRWHKDVSRIHPSPACLQYWSFFFFFSGVQLSCLLACGILVPPPGIKLMSSALEGRVLTTGPPGKFHSGLLPLSFLRCVLWAVVSFASILCMLAFFRIGSLPGIPWRQAGPVPRPAHDVSKRTPLFLFPRTHQPRISRGYHSQPPQ